MPPTIAEFAKNQNKINVSALPSIADFAKTYKAPPQKQGFFSKVISTIKPFISGSGSEIIPTRTSAETTAKIGMDFVNNLYNTYLQTPTKLKEDIIAGSKDITAGKPIKGITKTAIRTSADVANAIYAPISSAIGAILNTTGGQKLIDETGQIIADKTGITDLPAFQKFAMEHPNAGEDFNRILILFMSKAEKGKIEPVKLLEESKNYAQKIIDGISNKPQNIKVQSVGGESTKLTKTPKGDFAYEPIKEPTAIPQVQNPKLGRLVPPDTQPIQTIKQFVEKQQKNVTPTTDPLITEARKYRGAEEFVKAQGTPLLHGSNNKFDSFDFSKSGSNLSGYATKNKIVSLTDDSGVAKHYGKNITDAFVDPSKIKEVKNLPLGGGNLDKIIEEARKEGYSAISGYKSIGGSTNMETGSRIVFVFDENALKTKSQLTDIWNKAQEAKSIASEQTTGKKTSGLAQSIEAKAIENKLTEGFKNLAGYDSSTIKEQAVLSDNLIKSGINEARAVLRGEKPLPDRLRGSSLIVAMEEHLKNNPNPQIAYELANSPLVSAVSQAGSELGLMQNRVQDSFTARVQEIRKAREATMEKRTGRTPEKAKKVTVEEIKKEIRKNSPTKQSWSDFVESIKCNY